MTPERMEELSALALRTDVAAHHEAHAILPEILNELAQLQARVWSDWESNLELQGQIERLARQNQELTMVAQSIGSLGSLA